jgi:hypothetical protein
MSDTKYIMRHGIFVIFSKYLGVEHQQMARMVWRDGEVTSAGFALHGYGEFQCYGRSISTGKRSAPEDEGLIAKAFEDGKMVMCYLDMPSVDGWVATNDPSLFPGATQRAATESLLHDLKIFS